MDYVKFGNTGLDVSRLCLGCMTYGISDRGAHAWTLDEDKSRPLIKQAIELGINFFDTANVYSDGTSEEIVGRALKDFTQPRRCGAGDQGLQPDAAGTERGRPVAQGDHDRGRSQPAPARHRLYRSLPDPSPRQEHAPRGDAEALHDVVKAGKVRYIGASSMYAWQFSKALYTSRLNGWTEFVSMQNHVNLLNREEEREMLPLCADQKIAVMPWSPLARGRLTRAWDETSERQNTDEFGKTLYVQSEESDRKIVEQVAAVAKARGVPQAQVAMAWLLQKKGITSPIIGASKPAHLTDAVAALSLKLTSEEIASLEAPYVPHAVAGFG